MHNDTVVAYSKTKEASLYFSHVVPIPSFVIEKSLFHAMKLYRCGADYQASVTLMLDAEMPTCESHWAKLLPPHLSSNPKFFKLLNRVSMWDGLNSFYHSMLALNGPSEDFDECKTQLIEMVKKLMGVNLLHDLALDRTYDALMTRYDLEMLPAIVPDEWTKMDDGSMIKTGSSDFRLTLLNVNLIDTTTASWSQIFSFREDIESQTRLQRLQRFFSKNYVGKSRSFIEDDLQTRLDDHAAVVRKHGFDTKMAKLEAVVSSKWLQGSLTGAGLAAICGHNEAALISGFTGILFEVGSTGVKLARRKFEFMEHIAQHPLGYIIAAHESLCVQKPT